MKKHRCPITYEPIESSVLYSTAGLKRIDPRLKQLHELPFTREELNTEAALRVERLSIQGVQPKLSANVKVAQGQFELVDINGGYILKPQHPVFLQLPENEDLTMKLAATVGIETPVHGLIWGKDKALTYFIKRFDRKKKKEKLPVEDFTQLAQSDREHKYNYSTEKLIPIIDRYCSVPSLDKKRLFEITLFNFLIGNEDMHLKNHSIIVEEGLTRLSPSYDLLNTHIVLNSKEEIALPLNGKMRNLKRKDFIEYFAYERLKLTKQIVSESLEIFAKAIAYWDPWIENSFLSDPLKEQYRQLLQKRIAVLGL